MRPLDQLGWAHARQVFPPLLLASLRNELAGWLAARGGSVSRWPWQVPGIDGQAVRLHERSSGSLDGLQRALEQLPSVYALALDATIAALLQEHLSWSEAVLSPIHNLRAKLPWRLSTSAFTTVPWHQDFGASDPSCDPLDLVTVWIPLSPADAFHGGLELIPRSHQLGWLPHRRGNRGPEVTPSLLAQTLEYRRDLQPVCVDAQPGDAVLFHQCLLHRSLPNRSRRCRWSLDLRYAEAGSSSGRPGLWQRDPLVGEPVDAALMDLIAQRQAAMDNPLRVKVIKRVDSP